MLQAGQKAPASSLNRRARDARVIGVSQDGADQTRQFVEQMSIAFPVAIDHDLAFLKNLGLPTVAVATHEFRTSARAQAAALGRLDFDAVYVPHPIQDQTRGEPLRVATLVFCGSGHPAGGGRAGL
ncbi:MAG: redoxin domain-containing protein [Acidobacteria bacterium]|nr:redoxin domain-containing protein [Acidobacteriota bacterium]